MSDALEALAAIVDADSPTSDAITTDDAIISDIYDLVQLCLVKIREKIERGNDTVQTTTILKFLPVVVKLLEKREDTSLEDTREECRVMMRESFMA